MAKHPDDDLFAASTMSFGDHLEELRGALFRSVMGLMVGFLIGLGVADYIVKQIKAPLADALEDYYINKSIHQIEQELGEGTKLDDTLKEFLAEHRLVFEKVYLEASEVDRLTGVLAEERSQDKPAPSSGDRTAGPMAEATSVHLASNPPETVKNEKKPPGEPIKILGEPIPRPSNTMVATRIWRPIQTVVKALSAHEVFMIWMKAALVAGAIIASPYIFVQIWNFVAAGLYPHEKRYVYTYLPFSIGLFVAGVALAYYGVIGEVLKWLFTFNERLNIDPDPRINEWIGFVLFLPLGFGISFQLPLVMLLLNRIGIFSVEAYLAKWRIAILVIFVVSMILTPADPVSMLFMAIPLSVLYFGGIAMCKYMPRGQNPFDAAYEP